MRASLLCGISLIYLVTALPVHAQAAGEEDICTWEEVEKEDFNPAQPAADAPVVPAQPAPAATPANPSPSIPTQPGTGQPPAQPGAQPGTSTPTAPGTTPGATPGASTPAPAPVQSAPAPKPVTTTPKPPTSGGGGVVLPTGNASSCARGITMSKMDRASVNRAVAAKATLQAAASRHGIDWRLLAAIGVRETGFRNINNPDPNDPGMGVFQLTSRPGVTVAQARDLTFSANYAARLMAQNISIIKRRFPRFTQAQVIQAAAASYNFGVDDISGNPNTIDQGTTGNNYGQNILLLMNCF